MNVTGVGPNIAKALKNEPANGLRSTRTNGTDQKSLESGNEFKKIVSDKFEKPDKVEKSDKTEVNAKSKKPQDKEPTPSYEAKRIELKPKVTESAKTLSKDDVTTVEKLDEVESTQPKFISEEQSMMKFLYAMQTELGVEPEEVVGAMASLDAQTLDQPPEQTMKVVLSQLELPPQKEARAEELYQVMLKETSQASMGRMLDENNQSVDFAVVGPEQLRMQKLLQSLDDLNGQFFDPVKPAVVKPLNQPNPYDNFVVPTRNLNPPVQPGPMAATAPNLNPAPEMPAMNAQSYAGAEAIEGASSEELAKLDDLLSQLNARGLKIEAAARSPAPAVQSSQAAMPITSVDVLSDNSGGDAELDSRSKDQPVDSLKSDLNTPIGQAPQRQEILNTANAVRPGTPNVRTADDAANTRQLMDAAQMLAQKGGGSMKVQMRPEGLGNVELKVGVQNGKVDIQMTTENSETKRLLEGGLSDLKLGLVQHKLTLESVQVDTNNNMKQSFDSMPGQDRNTAREFLEQFREFNQNRRQAGFDFGVGGYGSQNKKLRPEDIKTSSSGKAKDRRLDLVA